MSGKVVHMSSDHDCLSHVLTVSEAADVAAYTVGGIWYLLNAGYLRWRYTSRGQALVDLASLEAYLGRSLSPQFSVYSAKSFSVSPAVRRRLSCSSVDVGEAGEMIVLTMDAAQLVSKRVTERGTTIATFRDMYGGGDVSLATRDGIFDACSEGELLQFQALCKSGQYGFMVQQMQSRTILTAEQWRQVLSDPGKLVRVLEK